jgi:hypothetical protein
MALYFHERVDKTKVVNRAGLVVPEQQLERVVGNKDRVGPFNSCSQRLGNELSRFDPCIVRSPKGPTLRNALLKLCANVQISTGLRAYQREAKEQTAAANICPLRWQLEGNPFHRRTLDPARQARQPFNTPLTSALAEALGEPLANDAQDQQGKRKLPSNDGRAPRAPPSPDIS